MKMQMQVEDEALQPVSPASDLATQDLSRVGALPDPIVCVSDLLWDEHWSSEQQLMSRLASRGRVLYVERTVSVLSFFTGSSDTSIGRQFLRFFSGGIRFENPNLTILSPPPVLPFRFNWLVNGINEWIRAGAIRRALKRMNARAPVLWIYAPDAGRIIGKLGERFSLYYCADDWSASDQWWNRSQDIRAREGELATKVDVIVGTSTRIVQRWSRAHAATMLVTNGADVQAFMRARDSDLEVPYDLRSIPEPRIGFIGFIDGRFNTQLYEALAKARPHWSFVVVGPVNDRGVDVSRLSSLPNVHFLGGRPRATLPGYLKGFDVCTIPYVINQLSDSIFPLKLFEYLAAGRPVVASMLPELKPFEKYLRMADSDDAFRDALDETLTRPLEPASMEFLRANSWDTKASMLWDLISQRLLPVHAAPSAVRRQ